MMRELKEIRNEAFSRASFNHCKSNVNVKAKVDYIYDGINIFFLLLWPQSENLIINTILHDNL